MSDTLTADEERRLIEQARCDPEAFRTLYRAYLPRVYGYVAYRVGRRQDAEDLVADVFVKVLEYLDRFEYRGEGSFAAWVFRIASNHVNAFYRRRGRRGEPIPLADLPEIPGDGPRPDEALIRQERFDSLRRMIDTLPPRRQKYCVTVQAALAASGLSPVYLPLRMKVLPPLARTSGEPVRTSPALRYLEARRPDPGFLIEGRRGT